MKKLALTFVVTALLALSAFTAEAKAHVVNTGWYCGPNWGQLVPYSSDHSLYCAAFSQTWWLVPHQN